MKDPTVTGRFSIVPSRAYFDSRLSAGDLLVLGLVCSYANRDGWCFPSQSTLATLLEISRRTVVRHIKNLVDFGYLTTEGRTRDNGSSTSNLYRVLYDSDIPEEFEKDNKPVPPKVEEAKVETPPAAQAKPVVNTFALAKHLAVLCQMDFEANRGMLLKEAKAISSMEEFSIDALNRIYAKPDGVWWSQDFRGKRGSYPFPSQIRTTWKQLQELVKVDTTVGSTEGWFYA